MTLTRADAEALLARYGGARTRADPELASSLFRMARTDSSPLARCALAPVRNLLPPADEFDGG